MTKLILLLSALSALCHAVEIVIPRRMEIGRSDSTFAQDFKKQTGYDLVACSTCPRHGWIIETGNETRIFLYDRVETRNKELRADNLLDPPTVFSVKDGSGTVNAALLSKCSALTGVTCK